jgi:CTP-dependent riboflavin kinase
MKPFPGTLNLKVKGIPPLEPLEIPAFGKFGAVGLVPCAVNGERAFAVFPKKGRHEEGVIEIIAEKNIKALLNLEDGDFVDIQF